MSKAILSSTQINVAFSIQIDSNRETDLINLLTLLCQLLISFWRVGAVVYQAGYNLATLASDIKEAITFHLKVLSIGFTSLAFGMGVRL